MHGASMVDSGANLQQETSVYVYVILNRDASDLVILTFLGPSFTMSGHSRPVHFSLSRYSGCQEYRELQYHLALARDDQWSPDWVG